MTATPRPPVPYFGGKQRIAGRIAAAFPEHAHYVEPYCGSLSVLFAKTRSTMETVSDLSGDLMTFWRVLRDQPETLAWVCSLTPHARAEQELSLDRPESLDDVERARRVWVCLTQGRSAMMGRTTGWRHYEKPVGSMGMPDYLASYAARLLPAAGRLAGVSLENLPALDLITKYGQHADTLLYVDPPYLGSTRRAYGAQYEHELRSEPEHRDLLDALLTCNASVVLSGYDSPLYARMLAGWSQLRIAATAGGGAAGDRERAEVLWSNRDIADQPGLFDLDGRVEPLDAA